MSTGPEHYAAAERALDAATKHREVVSSLRGGAVLGRNSAEVRAAIAEREACAELDLKAAHVHALLAVAAASVQSPSFMGAGNFTVHHQNWQATLAATPKEN